MDRIGGINKERISAPCTEDRSQTVAKLESELLELAASNSCTGVCVNKCRMGGGVRSDERWVVGTKQICKNRAAGYGNWWYRRGIDFLGHRELEKNINESKAGLAG